MVKSVKIKCRGYAKAGMHTRGTALSRWNSILSNRERSQRYGATLKPSDNPIKAFPRRMYVPRAFGVLSFHLVPLPRPLVTTLPLDFAPSLLFHSLVSRSLALSASRWSLPVSPMLSLMCAVPANSRQWGETPRFSIQMVAICSRW